MNEHEQPSDNPKKDHPPPLNQENREDNDDSGEQYTLQEDYFTSARPTTDRHRW